HVHANHIPALGPLLQLRRHVPPLADQVRHVAVAGVHGVALLQLLSTAAAPPEAAFLRSSVIVLVLAGDSTITSPGLSWNPPTWRLQACSSSSLRQRMQQAFSSWARYLAAEGFFVGGIIE
ncbi:unnamed protein product, partial [Ectocarpus sp. 12 AP-2014]